MILAPIALFVYNRPMHTRQAVEALLKNVISKDSDLIIFSDAPKNPELVDAVCKVRQYIRTIAGFKTVKIVERAQNRGLAHSIIDGVTTVVNKHGRVIVLEDDLVVTPHFLDFMNHALDRYEGEEQVIQVSGYMFPVKIKIKEDALFLPLTTSWGWATWQQSWQLFDPDAKGYDQVKKDLVMRKRFNLDGAYDYFSMLEAHLAGKVDSWAVRWQLSAFLSHSLAIYPRHSLVVNAGFDGTGTHGAMNGLLALTGKKDGFSPQSFPAEIKSSEAWVDVCRAINNRFSLLDRIRSKTQIFLSRFTKVEKVSS